MVETGMRIRSLGLLASALFILACGGDSSGPGAIGPLATFFARSGGSQDALAGTALPNPIVIVPQDASGHTIPNQTPTFTVIAGGGFVSSSTGTTNPDGTVTAPTWTLGKSAVPQQLRVTLGSTTTIIDATVRTAYSLEVRFYGAALSTGQRDLFTSAAARVRAMIVGAIPLVNVNGADVSGCKGTAPSAADTLKGTIDGLVIYASIDSIDGSGTTLARAGPCYFRLDNTGAPDYRTVIGVMKFDSADVRNANPIQLQSTIIHEMLHVVGLGTYWGASEKNLLINEGAPGTAYTGAGGIAGCRAVGGTITCASSVPVEDCVGVAEPCGPGTRDGHWKESTFRSELMTGYAGSGPSPLSVMSIRSFDDLGYTSNPAAADAYTIAIGSLSASGFAPSPLTASAVWERRPKIVPRGLPTYPLNFTRSQ
jgi:hypothetical protein